MKEFEDTVLVLNPHRYIYAPERKRSPLQWAMMTCTILAMAAIGVMLVRGAVVWLSNGRLM